MQVAAAGEKEKIMVPLGAVESRWVPLGAERFGSSLRISELLSQ